MNASESETIIPARSQTGRQFGSRLTVLIMTTASVALLLSSITLGTYNVFSLRGTIVDQLATDADSIAMSSTATLAFDDRVSAKEDLATLRNKPHVTMACLYDKNNAPFAIYTREDGPTEAPLTKTPPLRPGELGERFADDHVEIFHDVIFGDESIGTVFIRRDLLDIDRTWRRTTWIVIVVFLISLSVAMVSTHHFKRRLVRPIDELVHTAAAIAQSQDYSKRATKFNDDELGALTDAFNRMVADVGEYDAERRDLVAELEAKNAELERFTYTVSHDLKSPLVTISGFMGLLVEDASSGNREGLTRDIAVIKTATQTMRRLLDDLLELSRIGRVANPEESLQMPDLVQETVNLLQGTIRENKVQLHIEAQDDLPLVRGDRVRLIEVLQNLIENAIKFLDHNSERRIDIRTFCREREIVFSVQDKGRGIDPRYHDKVFGLFERIDQDVDGTGVGLALVRRIISFHGGRTWLESEGLGHGTTFYFSLPLDAPE